MEPGGLTVQKLLSSQISPQMIFLTNRIKTLDYYQGFFSVHELKKLRHIVFAVCPCCDPSMNIVASHKIMLLRRS
jgi:hypothetical protein